MEENALETFAIDAMQRYSVPGAAIGVSTSEGRELLTLGVNALDTRFDIRPDTLFQIGSISKPMTATLIIAMVERGELELDVPVNEYVPDLRLASEKARDTITLRQLLSHQGGFWGDWFEDFGMADDAMERFVAEYARLPQLFEPGELWAYNNCGYILAGLAATRASGETFEETLHKYLLEPLEMDRTFLSAADAIAYPVAVGHTNDPDTGEARIARQFLRPRARNPAGGVLASVEDVLTFAELHLGRTQSVLSPDAIRSMREPQIPTFEANTYWGLGFAVENVGGRPLVGHGGATNGFRAQLAMAPEDDVAVVVLANSDSGNRFADDIVARVLEDRIGIRREDLPRREPPEELVSRLEGRYEQPYASIEVEWNGTSLAGRMTTHSPYSEDSASRTGERFQLEYTGEGRFVVVGGELDGAQMKFWMNADGAVRFLQAVGRLYVPGSWSQLEGVKAA